MKIALLTGGKDPHYVRGLARELAAMGMHVALIGSRDEMVGGAAIWPGGVELHDLVGEQGADARFGAKVARVLKYFGRLFAFVATTDVRLFHILWFRRFPQLERIFLIAYLKILRKTVVFTAHNIDDAARDGRNGGLLHRVSLAFMYRMMDHVFVHTNGMKQELTSAFRIPADKVTVVPLGINDVVPASSVSRTEARQRLNLDLDARILLFFGNIAPYKGLEDLLRALADVVRDDDRVALVIAGRVKDKTCEAYWRDLEALIAELGVAKHVRKELRYIPDGDVGLFFRAADVSVLPYRRVYQSGVLGLSYAQGLPVIAADVGSMRDEIVEGETGYLFRAGDAGDLAAKIRAYFASGLLKDLEAKGPKIIDHGTQRFSWKENAERTRAVYEATMR